MKARAQMGSLAATHVPAKKHTEVCKQTGGSLFVLHRGNQSNGTGAQLDLSWSKLDMTTGN